MIDIKFTIDRIENGIAYGYLTWNNKGLNSLALSGPHGNGDLPDGLYKFRKYDLNERSPNNHAYCDSLNKCWFQFLQPQFSTNRTELGVHPDGNTLGTLGCIGLLDSDTSPWHQAFSETTEGFLEVHTITI